MTMQHYHDGSRKFLAQARQELAAGDVPQASEKGWGAAALMVKAICQQRGWDHQKHGALFNAVSRLVNETGDEDLNIGFHIANSLHVNFYEHWDTADRVEQGLNNVERFVDRLEPLLTE